MLNIVATYERSLYALAVGLFCGRWPLMALDEVDCGLQVGCAAAKMVKYTAMNERRSGSI